MSSTNPTLETGTPANKCSTSDLPAISERPAMIELKKLLAKQSPERREALDRYLEDLDQDEGTNYEN